MLDTYTVKSVYNIEKFIKKNTRVQIYVELKKIMSSFVDFTTFIQNDLASHKKNHKFC
jgi:hypothetical protein